MVNKNEIYILREMLNKRLTELHWFYSPVIFADSIVNSAKVKKILKSSEKYIAVLDRNIFSRLINVLTKGIAKQGSTKDIAIFILWCAMLEMNILPYFALNEYATGQNSELKAQEEYDVFQQMFEKIKIDTWMELAMGFKNKNTYILEPNINISDIVFNDNSIDYLSNFASLLHFEYVWRTEKDNVERFKSFFQWYYTNLKVSRYMTVYVCAILLNMEGYKLPKKINSKDYNEFILGCQNQARDISYLTSISVDRMPSDKYEFIFITDDNMLGDIFTRGCFNYNPIRMFEENVKNGGHKISEWVNNLLKNHTEVTSKDYMSYCNNIIEEEIKK